MFKKIKSIKSYKCLLNKNLYIQNGNKFSVINKKTLKEELEINRIDDDGTFLAIYTYNDREHFITNSGMIFKLGDIFFSKIELPSGYFVSIKKGEGRYISTYIYNIVDILQKRRGIFDLESNMVLWDRDDLDFVEIVDGYCFGISETFFERVDIKTGETIWRLKFEDFEVNTNFDHLVGVLDSVLIFSIGEPNKMLAVDIDSGFVMWKLNKSCSRSLFDAEKCSIKGFRVNYNEIDLKTGKVLDLFIDTDYFEKIGICSQRDNFIQLGDHLITTDWRKGKIGAFNTKTHKFDWIHEEKGVYFPSPQPIGYSAPYLFVQDNNNSLHIFEKE